MVDSHSTVRDTLQIAGIAYSDNDKVNPPLESIVSDSMLVKVIRVQDEYYTEQVIIPFEHQELKNEALPDGERRLSQPGENGLEEITYHRVLEDDVVVSDIQVKSTIIKEAVPEIVMIGSRTANYPFDIPGKIAYLSAGNAWLMESNTGNRSCVVCTGDLDGRIFSLSPNRRFLLFTRTSSDVNSINSLWAASLFSDPTKLIDLQAFNIVHYAEFSPDSASVAFSMSEWREAAPGWQANNDLFEVTISKAGYVGEPQQVLETSSGGVYGWWGTLFSWAPDQSGYLYSRPDSIGLVNPGESSQLKLMDILPYQTGGYWAWVPGISWSPDSKVAFTVDHRVVNSSSGGETQEFDLVGLPVSGGVPIDIVKNVGMFAYPVASPTGVSVSLPGVDSGNIQDDKSFSLAYLQAIFPDQSETSGYRLFIVNRDGTSPRSLFPEEGMAGIKPQRIAWSPDKLGNDGDFAIALIYNGNIWIIHTATGNTQQITGDGLTSRIDWR